MNEHKHTPGPWNFDPEALADIQTESGKEIASAFMPWASGDEWVIQGTMASSSPEESYANARLIAAAPELLEALEGCLTCEFPVIDRDAVSKALAAIAKATGKEPA